MTDKIEEIEVSRVFLYEENPRHAAVTTQEETIAYLCKDEQVLELARSICRDGTNPLEVIGVVAMKGARRGAKNNYKVWEGNRRICAIKLLNDPELAPANQRSKFEKLAEDYTPIRKVKAVVFKDKDRLKFWMANIHGGEQGGVGRRQWKPDAKSRATGSKRDANALAIMDFAEAEGFISADERKKRLTTLTRYVSNPELKGALGLDTSRIGELQTDLTDDDFKAVVRKLVSDLVAGTIHSRDNREQIQPYARNLPNAAGVSTERVDLRPITDITEPPKRSKKKKPKSGKPKRPDPLAKIQVVDELQVALESAGSHKLALLYFSICDVSAQDHPHLVAIGAWAFIESLTALTGRNENTAFPSYFSGNKLETLGFPKADRTAIRDAFTRLSSGGNTTKHHKTSGTFDAAQIINDMQTVTPVLLATLQSMNDS